MEVAGAKSVEVIHHCLHPDRAKVETGVEVAEVTPLAKALGMRRQGHVVYV